MMRKRFRGGSLFGAVGIGERNAVDVAGKGREAGFIRMRFAGERHGEKGAAVDGVFDGFGAGVEEDGLFREIARSQGVEFFGDGNVAFVGSDGEEQMQMPLELFADGGEHARRAMADVEASNAASEIKIAIAVDVLDGGAVRAGGENWSGIRRAAWNGGFAAGHQGAGLGAWYFGANLNGVHGFRFSISSEKQIPRSAEPTGAQKARFARNDKLIYQYQPMGVSSRLTNTCLVSRYSSSPQGPSSRPKPDCL